MISRALASGLVAAVATIGFTSLPSHADPSSPAIEQRRGDFPDAWNELGYALRNQGRYSESLDAYHEALRLRPEFPEALEYLGEAYVKLGRLDDRLPISTESRSAGSPSGA